MQHLVVMEIKPIQKDKTLIAVYTGLENIRKGFFPQRTMSGKENRKSEPAGPDKRHRRATHIGYRERHGKVCCGWYEVHITTESGYCAIMNFTWLYAWETPVFSRTSISRISIFPPVTWISPVRISAWSGSWRIRTIPGDHRSSGCGPRVTRPRPIAVI